MDAFEFVSHYTSYLEEIEQVIKPELQTIIDELKEQELHDLIRPDTFFINESVARGYVFSMFLKRVNSI